MSIRVMSRIWESELPWNEKLIALAFADFATDEGMCFPSIARVAWKCGTSERTIQRMTEKFRAIGFFDGSPTCGRGNTNVYFIRPEKLPQLAPFIPKRQSEMMTNVSPFVNGDSLEKVTLEAIKGDNRDVKGDTGGIKGDTAVSPESLESSLEPSVNHQAAENAPLKYPKPEKKPKVKTYPPKTQYVREAAPAARYKDFAEVRAEKTREAIARVLGPNRKVDDEVRGSLRDHHYNRRYSDVQIWLGRAGESRSSGRGLRYGYAFIGQAQAARGADSRVCRGDSP